MLSQRRNGPRLLHLLVTSLPACVETEQLAYKYYGTFVTSLKMNSFMSAATSRPHSPRSRGRESDTSTHLGNEGKGGVSEDGSATAQQGAGKCHTHTHKGDKTGEEKNGHEK